MKKIFILIVFAVLLLMGCESDSVDVPTKKEVYAKRDEVLAGMRGAELDRLRETIKALNLSYEDRHLNENLFEKLEDPEDWGWNYIEKTGMIRVGWELDPDLVYDESSGYTKEEWEKINRKSVMRENNMDAAAFIKVISELQASMKTNLLDDDFNNLTTNMAKAKETHDVKYLEEVYHILHDMDYYLLRYGPEDVAPYTEDDSTVTLYYGALEVYK